MSYTNYGGDYNYLFQDTKTNQFIAYNTKRPINGLHFEGEELWHLGSYNIRVEAKCEKVITKHTINGVRTVFSTPSDFCNASKIDLLPCRNPFIVGGITYCE